MAHRPGQRGIEGRGSREELEGRTKSSTRHLFPLSLPSNLFSRLSATRPTPTTVIGLAALLFAVLFTLSCRSNPGVQVPATIDPDAGKVAAKLIPDPAAPTVELGKDEQFVPPQIMPGNPLPEYPPDLIALSLPPQTIAVRFYANEKSKIDSVVDSPIAASTAGPYCAKFEQAVRDALRQWTVYPARIRKFRPGPDSDGDGKPDYQIMTAQTTLRSFFDMTFVFQVVDGKGVVKSTQ